MKGSIIQWIDRALEVSRASYPEDRQYIPERWEDLLRHIEKELLPSGHGYDNGTTVNREQSTSTKIVLDTAFHHMNDVGYYVKWTEHKVIFTPNFSGGCSIKVTGRDYRGIKEGIEHCFLCELDAPDYEMVRVADDSAGFRWKLEEVVEEMETSPDTNK